METLIVEAKDQQELDTVKAVLRALKVSFRKNAENPYSQNLIDVIERGRKDAKEGRTTVVKPGELWKSD